MKLLVINTEFLFAQGHPGSSTQSWAHCQSNGVHWAEYRLISALNNIVVVLFFLFLHLCNLVKILESIKQV